MIHVTNFSSFKFFESSVVFNPGGDGFPPVAIDDSFDIYVNGAHYTTLVMNPSHVEEAVVGALLGDGLIKSPEEILELNVDPERRIVRVNILGEPEIRRLHLEDCSMLAARGLIVDSNLRVSWDTIVNLFLDFNRRTVSVTRGLAMHTSALYDMANGKAIIVHDTSRHTSIAKLIGIAVREKLDFRSSIGITTGRASSDMVIRFANMKVPIVISTRGPLYSGLTAASLLKVTLVTYIRRGDRVRGLTVLTYPERIVGYHRSSETLKHADED